MQQKQQLNQFTVDWQKSAIAIDVSQLPGYAANVETFRRDGWVGYPRIIPNLLSQRRLLAVGRL